MTNKEQHFIDFVKSECKKYKVKCKLENKPYLKLGNGSGMSTCSGYFDGEYKVLACAIAKEEWITVLAHEYSHLTQWVDQCKEWVKADKKNTYQLLANWLEGEPVRNIKYHLGICRDLELDNEKRTVEVIKKFDLDVDIDLYIQKSNAYVQFYNYMYYTRKWSTPQNSPYTQKEIYENCSKKFNMKYKSMSNRIKLVYDKVYSNPSARAY
jgi:hypothetical protein